MSEEIPGQLDLLAETTDPCQCIWRDPPMPHEGHCCLMGQPDAVGLPVAPACHPGEWRELRARPEREEYR